MPEPNRQQPDGQIVIRGARTHNLKNIDLTLPQERLIIVTGVSGSGKSSLAFDTVYAEGQRRYVESLSAYARQFLERMEKPDVDRIEGICPAIAIRQKNSVRNPRSTVGTTTEIYDYLRLLFARVGRTICRGCGVEVTRETPEAVAGRLAALPDGTRLLVGFVHAVDASAVAAALDGLRRKGFGRLHVDGRAVSFDDLDPEALAGSDALQVVVDRIRAAAAARPRLTEAIETAYQEGGGNAFAVEVGGAEPARHEFSERFECRPCGMAYEEPQPTLFSFNSPFGACPTCHGFGNVIELDMRLVVPDETKSIAQGAVEPWTKPHYRSHLADLKRAARRRDIRMTVPWSELSDEERRFVIEGDGAGYDGIRGFFSALERKKYKVHVRVFLSRYRGYRACADCGGTRLRREARDVRVGGRTIDEIAGFTVAAACRFFEDLTLSAKETAIAERVIREIRRRVGFLSGVGLDYLTLDRLSSTLSGGEAQRINLATSLGSSLVGTLYVLDEPSIGLHPRDNERLIRILGQLRDQGNTVLVVEHDADMIRASDYVVDLGLGAGTRGGRVVYAGGLDGLSRETTSLTAKYLRGDLAIPIPAARRRRLPNSQALRVRGAAEHNLKGIDVEIPLNMLTCVTGVSGSGKSTLVHDVMYAAVKRAKGAWEKRVGAHDGIDGVELLNDVVLVDQTPIGRTPRSNPVTYLKAFDPIRELFAATRAARARGFSPSHFSFNVPGGRCDACEGEGEVRVEMQFLADVFMPCEQCDGKRFKPQVLEVTWRGLRVDEVLDLTAREALQFFGSSPKVVRKLKVLDEIGLGYLRLGQPATTLSGGEAQRIKIAAHLSTRHGDRSLYIFDEPTTGLHFDDISKLLAAFSRLVDAGHTLLVIEHNLDVIKTADWIVDLGPEGGEAGGEVVVA
ncbi:MAG: excinuclease ABC subunit UvrA, partial [Acidobacteria bacterium]|nr:excinuclease ABC subunit UvrA [Acidobacteriota bacterium]